MHWLTGGASQSAVVATKAVLMYGTALFALRLGERRTLAQWTIIDFATAVAMGAIIGRTAVASNQSWLTGAVAVVTLVAVHRVVSMLRLTGVVARLVDHRVRVLVVDGAVRTRELRKCAITDNDLYAHLRQQGYVNLSDVRYVLYEAKGDLTVVPASAARAEPLVRAGLVGAANFTPGQPPT